MHVFRDAPVLLKDALDDEYYILIDTFLKMLFCYFSVVNAMPNQACYIIHVSSLKIIENDWYKSPDLQPILEILQYFTSIIVLRASHRGYVDRNEILMPRNKR